jgi:CheY-like chemotaxis protein
MMARAVQRLLGTEHDIVATTDPKVAVDLILAGKRFDAILCDLMMPVMSGMDVYEAIFAVDPAQARRFIFMTGGTFTERAEQFLERVGNPRLDKPLDRAALRAAVRAMS